MELLVSLAITALSAALLVAAIGTGRLIATRSETATTGSEALAAAQGLLRDRLERLVADGGKPGDEGNATEGNAARLSFTAPAPAADADRGLVRYLLLLQPNGVLDLAWTEADGLAPHWRAQPLLGHVAAMELAYFGPPPSGGAAGWWSEWRGRADPPSLVRVRLRFASLDQRRWPDLLVHPAATISTACTVDRTTGACQTA